MRSEVFGLNPGTPAAGGPGKACQENKKQHLCCIEVIVKCRFCAEEIQDAAVLCRFCGAEKRESEWYPPSASFSRATRPKGSFTIKATGVLFVLSGGFSLMTVSSDVPLLGALRGGVTALCYNLFFAALFSGIGIGLLVGKAWGYRLLLAGTAVYCVDRLLFAANKGTRDAYLAASGVTEQVEAFIDARLLDQAVIIGTLSTVACWLGFALYIYLRRDYLLRAAAT